MLDNTSISYTNTKKTLKKSISFFYIFLGIFLALIIKFFALDIFSVQGKSMLPLIKDGQTIFVNKLAYGISKPFGSELLVQWSEPKENDVVIYLYNNNYVVKRCVATSGTSLDYLSDLDYSLIVDGRKKISLSENQFHKMFKSSSVPQNYILAIGDNYDKSYDSRNYGFVPVKNILGKVICK